MSEEASTYQMTAACPHCKVPLQVPMYAPYNVEQYGTPVTVVTRCCKKPIRLRRIVILEPEIYEGSAREDDWGTPIK